MVFLKPVTIVCLFSIFQMGYALSRNPANIIVFRFPFVSSACALGFPPNSRCLLADTWDLGPKDERCRPRYLCLFSLRRPFHSPTDSSALLLRLGDQPFCFDKYYWHEYGPDSLRGYFGC
ncbi:hypothetical protein BS47DRAFT_1344470 [Hydnum rufescens UP504]|uniref:Secreted protein n=1 Tax=Hydnum rufescens UP504 TaxID=1448309 RepID=A0A9P6AWF7_9AGAM|nr:hypothetical protein BS47DRAFT_1344470 [Hydnum rufescens UP504]